MKKMKCRIIGVACLAAALALGWGMPAASAAELKPGVMIDASNLEKIKNDTFEGHKIGDMIPDKMEQQIKQFGLTLKLRHSADVPIDPRLVDASKKNKDRCKFDPKTRTVSGWEAGWPFPDVSADDPYAADKLIWNHHYGQPHGNFQYYPDFAFIFIDPKKGIERFQDWTWNRYFMKGRLGGKSVEGDGSVYTKVLMFAKSPKDIAGLGTFSLRYDSPKFEDSWAYLKSVRRVRRLPGGSWMDPIGGTDILNDDQESFNAYPTWYPKYRLLGKRWILAVAHSELPRWDESKKGTAAEFPRIDLSKPPYWNSKDAWEPREVWVIECTTPPEHPYSKKIIYMETKFPRIYLSEMYDRKGDLWKWMDVHLSPYKADDGSPAVISSMGYIIDLKRNHATIWALGNVKVINKSNPDALSLGQLEAAGR
jgi:hypothetical protein